MSKRGRTRGIVRIFCQKQNTSNRFGAGEGNRTLVFSLGSCCSAIELHPHAGIDARSRFQLQEGLERVAGIEPAYLAWKATALPLSYTRTQFARLAFIKKHTDGGGGWIRTSVR